DVETEIDYVEKNLKDRIDDGGTSRTPEHHVQPTITLHHGGRHCTERSLSRPNSVGFSLNQAKHIRNSWPAGKIVHFVIHQKATPGNRHPRPVASVDGGSHSDAVTSFVHYGVVGCFSGLFDRGCTG